MGRLEGNGAERPLFERLVAAIQSLWSGEIQVAIDGRRVGSIVLSEGRIAWAVCRDQSETLGAFLWRLGRITREQFAQAQEVYQAHKGRKMLGAILEDSGFMSRALLRRCIMLHTRSAIAKILASPDVSVKLVDGKARTDEHLLFGPEEVLPANLSEVLLSEWRGLDNTWVRSWYELSEENEILENFIDLPSYGASAIITYDGDVVTAHVEDRSVDLPVFAAHVAAMLESSLRAMRSTRHSDVDLIMIDCLKGGLSARWIDDESRYLIFLLFGEEGKSSLVRYALKAERQVLREWLLAKQGQGQGQEPPAKPALQEGIAGETPIRVPWPEQPAMPDLFSATATGVDRSDQTPFAAARSGEEDKSDSNVFSSIKPPKD